MMARIERFEDIQSWQQARVLVTIVYKLSNNWKDHSLKSQIRRAAVSIMNNIAEGFERQTNKDFRHFLYMAKGSCAEIRSMLAVIADLEIITADQQKELSTECEEISKLLSGLIKTL
jgi:four helix bundle protein